MSVAAFVNVLQASIFAILAQSTQKKRASRPNVQQVLGVVAQGIPMLQQLLDEVERRANESTELVIRRVLENLSKEKDQSTCKKHTILQARVRELSIRLHRWKKANRDCPFRGSDNDRAIHEHLMKERAKAHYEYHAEPCLCEETYVVLEKGAVAKIPIPDVDDLLGLDRLTP